MWWDILKESKLSGKAKGSTLDASKIKVNIREECKEKLRKLIMQKPKNDVTYIYTKGWEQMPEEVACAIIKDLKNITPEFDSNDFLGYMGYEVRYWNTLKKEIFDITYNLYVRCNFNNKMVFELLVSADDWEEWRKLL